MTEKHVAAVDAAIARPRLPGLSRHASRRAARILTPPSPQSWLAPLKAVSGFLLWVADLEIRISISASGGSLGARLAAPSSASAGTTVSAATAEQPGLMLALDRGGQCAASPSACRMARPKPNLDRLIRREMSMVPTAFPPRWIRVATADGPLTGAHFRHEPQQRPLHQRPRRRHMAGVLASACGFRGSMAEYLFATVQASRGTGHPRPPFVETAGAGCGEVSTELHCGVSKRPRPSEV